MSEFVAIVLAGGSGERFWPLSRQKKPKQFLNLEDSGFSLLQTTANRLAAITQSFERIFVVTASNYRGQVFDQLPELPSENLIIEPQARDTAPAILYAALHVKKRYPDAVIGVFASDHRITDTQTFADVVAAATQVAAEERRIVTLGITPNFPSTGYGYIQRGEWLKTQGNWPVYQVDHFSEKPDLSTAESFLASGLYSWNSGIFVWHIDTLLEEYQTHQSELYTQLSDTNLDRARVKEVFPKLQKISVDYAIMEKSNRVTVIPAQFGWDDLGDWNALERMLRGSGQNVSVGKHVGLDTEGAILYTTSGNDLIVTIGLEDVVIVRNEDVTLVVRKDRTQDIKKVVQRLKDSPELERFI